MIAEYCEKASKLPVLTDTLGNMPGSRKEILRYKNLKKFLTDLMSDHQWSQERLAKELGTKQPVVSAWLSGHSKPGERLRRKLAKMHGSATLDEFDAFLAGEEVPEVQLPQTFAEAWSLLDDLSAYDKLELAIRILEDTQELM